jgi:hypothetical protein
MRTKVTGHRVGPRVGGITESGTHGDSKTMLTALEHKAEMSRQALSEVRGLPTGRSNTSPTVPSTTAAFQWPYDPLH